MFLFHRGRSTTRTGISSSVLLRQLHAYTKYWRKVAFAARLDTHKIALVTAIIGVALALSVPLLNQTNEALLPILSGELNNFIVSNHTVGFVRLPNTSPWTFWIKGICTLALPTIIVAQYFLIRDRHFASDSISSRPTTTLQTASYCLSSANAERRGTGNTKGLAFHQGDSPSQVHVAPQAAVKTQPMVSCPAQASTNQRLAKKPSLSHDWKSMTDDDIVERGSNGRLPLYSLENALQDHSRAVKVRRRMVSCNARTNKTSQALCTSALPFENYDYAKVFGACCENVVGYMPLPLGLAGPLNIDSDHLYIPMATTEGVLVASTNRGATAINACGGVTTALLDDGMTRGPAIRFPSLARCASAKHWLDSDNGYTIVEAAFNATSNFGRLRSIKAVVAGNDLFVRFKATTGDAMGMNMISKGVEAALLAMSTHGGFSDMTVISLSGNFCTDKKAAALNWIDGRGKTVCAQAVITADVLRLVLKTDVDTLVEFNTTKNLVGSAMAGAMGGFNAHAANLVSAIFLATGQDPAQNVESSSCITLMKKDAQGNLVISVSMPSIEVGTVGGGTVLEPQGAMLDLLGVRGANKEHPGAHARRLACIVAAAVLAGELSLCSALAAGSLVQAHMAHNRNPSPAA